MKKSLFLNLVSHFGIPRNISVSGIPGPTIPIQQVTVRYYDNGQDYAIEQEFDGKSGYLYSYDISIFAKTTIPIHIKMADLHVFYLITGTSEIIWYNHTGKPVAALSTARARYFYLPPNDYQLQFEPGRLKKAISITKGSPFR